MGRAVARGGAGAARRSGAAGRAAVPIRSCWCRSRSGGSGSSREASRFSDRGRPSLAMETYVRLMVLKHRCGWGYETLMREVSDSIHLRRFCRLGLTERVPDESTVRKLTRRLGAEVVHQLTRELIGKARREKRFRPRAARIDSTVVEADIRYPTDSGLAADGIRALAREGRKLAAKIGAKRTAVQGSLARGRAAVARDDALDPPPLRAGQGGGARADQADRPAARQVGQGGAARWPRDAGAGRAGAAPRPSSRLRGSSRSSPTAARRWSSRSPSASRARRSPTG